MKAVELRAVDDDYKAHKQAFLNYAVKSEKKVGKNKAKPRYPTFDKFYDYEKEIKKVLGFANSEQTNRLKGLSEHLREKGGGDG